MLKTGSFRGEQLKAGSVKWPLYKDSSPYKGGEIYTAYSGEDGQRTGEKWAAVWKAEDCGRPHKLEEALLAFRGSVATPWFFTCVF